MSPVESSSPLLELEDLQVRLGSRDVLRGVSLQLEAGEILGLLGPNGSGKSTTLRVISGQCALQAGALRWCGASLSTVGWRRWAQTIGVVFQSPSLDLKLNARENLSLAAQLQGLSSAQRGPRVDAMLRFANLEARADEPVGQLSGGMRRRLDLARALLHEPRLLLLDEPTSGLDEAAFRVFWQQIATLRQDQGVSVIVATHRSDEADQCHRVAILDEGQVVTCDTPSHLKRQLASDVILLEVRDEAQRQTLAEALVERFGVACLVDGPHLLIECEEGHALIPRLVEAFPQRFDAVSLRRPSLADVFLKITGHQLTDSLASR